jgi:hypothetical protein
LAARLGRLCNLWLPKAMQAGTLQLAELLLLAIASGGRSPEFTNDASGVTDIPCPDFDDLVTKRQSGVSEGVLINILDFVRVIIQREAVTVDSDFRGYDLPFLNGLIIEASLIVRQQFFAN